MTVVAPERRGESDLVQAQMSALEACLSRSHDVAARTTLALAIVHEVLRRRLAEAESQPAPETVETARFDASVWAGDGAARLEVYAGLVDRVRERVRSVVPRASRVAVASRGDERLVDVSGLAVLHFPQGRDGRYAGYYPPDGKAALSHLRDLVDAGTEYLVLPATAYWWLDHYSELADFLRPLAVHADEDCTVFDLRAATPQKGAAT